MDENLPNIMDMLATKVFMRPADGDSLQKRLKVCSRMWAVCKQLSKLVLRLGVRSKSARNMLWMDVFALKMDPNSEKGDVPLNMLTGRMMAEAESLPFDPVSDLITVAALLGVGSLACRNRLTLLGTTLRNIQAESARLLRDEAATSQVVARMLRESKRAEDPNWQPPVPAVGSTPHTSARKHIAVVRKNPAGSASFLKDTTPELRNIFDVSITADEQTLLIAALELAPNVEEPEASLNLPDHARLLVEGGGATDDELVRALSTNQVETLQGVPRWGTMIKVARERKSHVGQPSVMGEALWKDLGGKSDMHARTSLVRLSGPQVAALLRSASEPQLQRFLVWISPSPVPVQGLSALADRFCAASDVADLQLPAAKALRDLSKTNSGAMRQDGIFEEEDLPAIVRLEAVSLDSQIPLWDAARNRSIGDFLEAWAGKGFVDFVTSPNSAEIAEKLLRAVVTSSLV
jgi:hypothetical protein